MPTCAIGLLLACSSGCAGSRPDSEPRPKLAVEAPPCNRARPPEKLDPRSVSWELVVPPHGTAQMDALIDTCTSVVSLANHDAQPTQLFRTPNGRDWSSSEIEGVEGARFFDLERGDRTWVAVGRSAAGGGVIAVTDRPGPVPWREVFSSPESPFEHVAFGAQTFVAQSRHGIAVSSNGTDWSWATVPDAAYFDVAFGNGRFVAAGVGAALSSRDGRVWESIRCPRGCEPPVLEDGRPSPERISMKQVHFAGDKFYAYGGSGSLESSDGVEFIAGVRKLADAAVGGMLVSMATDPEAHFNAGRRVPDPPRIHLSQDGGATYFSVPLTVRDDGASVDCASVPCIVVPQGILVLQPKEASGFSEPLCDGSTNIRLAYAFGGGFVTRTQMFLAPYGQQFFAIDGECRYWAQHGAGSAIVTGSITPEQASRLAEELAWRNLPDWGNYHPAVQCPDAGGATLGTARVALACGPLLEGSCGCGDEAPQALPKVMMHAREWAATLIAAGTAVNGAMSAIAERVSSTDLQPIAQPWPLSRSIASIPDLLAGPNSAVLERHARFEAPADTGLLRALRARATSDLSVRDGSVTYWLYLRDELPEDKANALRAFMGAWSYE